MIVFCDVTKATVFEAIGKDERLKVEEIVPLADTQVGKKRFPGS